MGLLGSPAAAAWLQAGVDRLVTLDSGNDVVVMPYPLSLILRTTAAQPDSIFPAFNFIPVFVLQLAHTPVDLSGQLVGLLDHVRYRPS